MCFSSSFAISVPHLFLWNTCVYSIEEAEGGDESESDWEIVSFRFVRSCLHARGLVAYSTSISKEVATYSLIPCGIDVENSKPTKIEVKPK